MNRREALAGLLTGPWACRSIAAGREPVRQQRAFRGGVLPVIGMGTWLTFDVGEGVAERERRAKVLDAFFAAGGGMIDSSPMYGRAEQVVGDLLAEYTSRNRMFSATKVWTPFDRNGETQVRRSLDLWRLPRLDLVHVHNLLNCANHLKTLRSLRERGLVRFIGVTTSHGRRHDEMIEVLRREPLDFVQLSYSVADTDAEHVIDVAAERGVAVIANRPFDGGTLVDRANRLPLPGWASEIDCDSWAQVLLKWIVSRPGIVCAIPATSDPAHMAQNMGGSVGRLPDPLMRRRILDHLRQAL